MTMTGVLLLAAAAAAAGGDQPPAPAATLIYGERNSARCFSSAFLELVRTETAVAAPEALAPVALGDADALFSRFFCLLSGEGFFRFTQAERDTLRSYLLEGGFVLASAGCSSAAWDASFRDQIAEILPDHRLEPIPEEHVIFSLLYPTAPLALRDGAPAQLEAMTVEGRIVLVYSPAGLNDTKSLPDCCCCTGNEVAESAAVTANIFLFALLQVPP